MSVRDHSVSSAVLIWNRYGPDAQRSTHLVSHTARNVVLVYVDMRGFARRALLKRAGKEFVKARVSGSGSDKSPAPTPVPDAADAAKAADA